MTTGTSPLEAETALLKKAQAELRAGRPERALAALDEHDAQFKQGVLREEQRAARILALCAAARTKERGEGHGPALPRGVAPFADGGARALVVRLRGWRALAWPSVARPFRNGSSAGRLLLPDLADHLGKRCKAPPCRLSQASRPIFFLVLALSVSALLGASASGCGPHVVVIGDDTGGGSACAAGGVAFATPVQYEVGAESNGIAAADLNGDGIPDLAIVNTGSSTVSDLLLNHGDGTFAPKVDWPTGQYPHAVVAAPLRGGSAVDLVVSNMDDNTLSVLFNNGDGTFTTVVVPLGEQPEDLAVADLDGDGKPDVIVTLNMIDEVGWLHNNGDGTFAPMVTYPTGAAPFGIAAADLNGDGLPDVIVTNSGDDTVSVLMNMGGGLLAPRVEHATGRTPLSVVAADLNGDGRLDLVVADSSYGPMNNGDPGAVSVLMGQGGGSFAPRVDYAAGRNPWTLAVADLNGDGKPDLVVADSESYGVSVLLGQGDGTFAAKIDFSTGAPEASSEAQPFGIVATDLNGDGLPDLAVASGGMIDGSFDAAVLLQACHP